MKKKHRPNFKNFLPIYFFTLFFSPVVKSQFVSNQQFNQPISLASNFNHASNSKSIFYNENKNETQLKESLVDNDENEPFHEKAGIPHSLSVTSGSCVSGTINRFTGSYHSNLYIGNSGGSNVLLAWGQSMSTYIGLATGNLTVPTTVSSASYGGVPLEVRSSSTGGANGLSALALRTDTKLYLFGTSANLTAITSMTGVGGGTTNTTLTNTTYSDITLKLPAGVAITDISQMAISLTAFAIVTNTGNVYILTKTANLQGDKAAAGPGIWHHVTLSNGTTFLTGVTKFSLSSSGAFALTAAGKIYYWGSPANIAGAINTTTSYNYAYDMSAQIPSGRTVTDLVALGSGGSNSTLFVLCDNQKVYGCGLNTNGVLGINNATTSFNQATFVTVKGTDGTTDLSNIVKIDGDTEADIFCMAAITSTGQIYGWGDSPAGMLGVNAATGSFSVPKTVQLFSPTPGVNFTDFSVAGHFIISFYTNGSTDQYWYLGHNTGGSIGDPSNSTAFILAAAPASLNASGGVSFSCSNAIPTINTSGSLSSFTGCAGTVSSAQSIIISGDNLLGDISITAPTGYELSTSAGGPFSGTVSLTPVTGTVASTTIYVRLTSTAINGASGNITCSSSSASQQTIASGAAIINTASIGGIINGSSVVTTGSNNTPLTLSGHRGSITKWQSAAAADFISGLSDITNTATNYTAVNLTSTTYYRAVVTSGVCPSANSSMATVTVTGVLPIKWLGFSARKIDKNVLLNWSIASEENCKDFSVQESSNNTDWNIVGIITASGNNSFSNNYSFLHPNPGAGIHYYRLLLQELNGNKSLSKTVSIAYAENGKQLTIFLNKIEDGILNLKLTNADDVNLYDSNGKLILHRHLFSGKQTLNIGNLAKGIYMVQSGADIIKILVE